MNLFLLWLLQHSIIAIFTCGLKDNLAHGVGNPARCRQRTEEWNRKGSDALLLHWTPGGHQNQFTRYRWKKPDAERFSLPCSRQCSRLRQCSTFEDQICSLRKSFTTYQDVPDLPSVSLLPSLRASLRTRGSRAKLPPCGK